MSLNTVSGVKPFSSFNTNTKYTETNDAKKEPRKENKKFPSLFEKDNYTRKEYILGFSGAALSGIVISSTIFAGRFGLKNLHIERLKQENKLLNNQIEKFTKKINEIFDTDIAADIKEQTYKKLKKEVTEANLDYDIKEPPRSPKNTNNVEYNSFLPDKVSTNNRADNLPLSIPETADNFSLIIPSSPEVKITKAKTEPVPKTSQMTTITASYADSVQWSTDKIVRDLLQNFYDGHGQTLDGVKITSLRTNNGNYKIRIEGKSTYTVDKAILLGESSKREDVHAAGNYGEGLKMSVLKLLQDEGCNNVKIASDNWELNYKLAESNISQGKKVLAYDVNPVEKFDGNYVEFEVYDNAYLKSLKRNINYFYHSGNEHFKCPDFENNYLGIKILPANQNGGIYIAGQRFEFNNDFDGLKGAVIFIKERLPIDIIDPSRDRTSLNNSNLQSIAKWVAQHTNISQQDKLRILKAIEPYWEATGSFSASSMDVFTDNFVHYLNLYSSGMKIKFPEKCIASSMASPDLILDLKNRGYKICKSRFNGLGMPTIHDVVNEGRAHTPVEPSKNQLMRIKILRNALQKLSMGLEGKHFTNDELNAKIYLFDKTDKKEAKLYDNALAEAILSGAKSNGFWIDKNYLSSADFSEVLETALHELSHKAGGDGSSSFSYKLTDVNQDAIKQIINNAQTRVELQTLNNLWKEYI